jgi:UDP-galactopyranose mutase
MQIPKKYDYVIVGAGFAGSVLAERLNSIGKNVLVIDKRNHIGGNCYDYKNKNGVLVHKYGPHYFRTNSKKVIRYLSKFTRWKPYECRIRTSVNGILYPFPINRDTMNKFFGVNLRTGEEAAKFLSSKREKIKKPRNAEEQVLALAGNEIYCSFFRNYTLKQWGIHPRDLDASVTARIPIRTNCDDRYFNDKFQAMPEKGYAAIFKKMLKGVCLKLNTDFKKVVDKIKYDNLIYTGPIDKFFNCKYGKLPYRSLRFKTKHYKKEFYQGWPQVNTKMTKVYKKNRN